MSTRDPAGRGRLPAPFNELTGTPLVLPITTDGRFARRRGFAVSL